VNIIADAQGDVEAALMVSGRYSAADLSGLTGNSLSLLKRIICEIAIAYLYERKPFYRSDRLEAYSKAKEGHLERLRSGVNVFNIPAVVAAGSPEATGPSLIDYHYNLNLITDRSRGYPARRMPFNR
jgi:hypothetical protein